MKVGEEYVIHDMESGEYHLYRLKSESKDRRVTESEFLGKVRYAKHFWNIPGAWIMSIYDWLRGNKRSGCKEWDVIIKTR